MFQTLLGLKNKRTVQHFSREQTQQLKAAFEVDPNPSSEDCEKIAADVGVQQYQVYVRMTYFTFRIIIYKVKILRLFVNLIKP